VISASEALERLREGNRRFMAGEPPSKDRQNQARRAELLTSQEPFAIILGCSDSRVPAEIIFDQGLGDLFVIRVAGNIVAPSGVGSIEFAAARFGTPLAVVLGHSRCGAVTATLEHLRARGAQSRNLLSIVGRVSQSIRGALDGPPEAVTEELVRKAVRANIRASVEQLRTTASPLLHELIQNGRLEIVGAKYSLKTGLVDFLEG
jgi:carbonic anhydrase